MKRLAGLLVILAACGALRVWLIAHSEVIARDGTTYVRMAQELPSGPRRVVQDYNYHIGYPVAMAGVHRVLLATGWSDDLFTWELSGQIVSLGASLAAVGAVWLFAGMTFNWRIAWISALLFGIGRKWSVLGADVLSDALAVCLQMWAVVFAILALDQLKRKSWWAVGLAACVGLCSGLGYLVRPEALLVTALAGAMWLVYQLRRRKSWRLTLASVGVSLAVMLGCALPYMMVIGGLTKKKSLSDLVALPIARDVTMATASFVSAGQYIAVRQIVNQLFEALHPLVGLLVCIWLAGYAIKRLGRSERAQLALPSPRLAGGFMMLGTLTVMGPLLMGLYSNVGYLSHRHVMFLAALVSPVAGAGVVVSTEFLTAFLKRIRVRKASQPRILAIMIGVMVVGHSLHTLRPLHDGKGYFRQAGQFVAESAAPGSYVLADSSWILHYSQVEGECLSRDLIKADGFGLWVQRSRATHLVLSDRTLSKANPGLLKKLVPPRFVEIDKFIQARPKRPDTIRIYRISREIPSQASDEPVSH